MIGSVEEIRKKITELVKGKLALAREAKISADQAKKWIFDALEDLGMKVGFLPDPIREIGDDLRSVVVEVLFDDYKTEQVVEV